MLNIKTTELMLSEFGAAGDGIADDTAAVQRAINRAVERTTRGVLFVPSGTYRLTKTIEIWPGIRVIGCGKTRPVFVLADDAPGFIGPSADQAMVALAPEGAAWQATALSAASLAPHRLWPYSCFGSVPVLVPAQASTAGFAGRWCR